MKKEYLKKIIKVTNLNEIIMLKSKIVFVFFSSTQIDKNLPLECWSFNKENIITDYKPFTLKIDNEFADNLKKSQ